ncbi:MAG: carbohydrate ABC transporter substrate-binding protein, partial [Firmicutes bacterium]|nr:carbohydrate ABC transporter substrate-binding protein [Bacillota bacterium]
MEQFIRDTGLGPDDLKLDYTPVINMYTRGEAAMITGSSARVLEFLNQGIDTVLLPYFGQGGEQWLMTTPYLQVALSRKLEQDEARREKAMRVLRVMLSEGGQSVLSAGQDVLTYSQNVGIHLTE